MTNKITMALAKGRLADEAISIMEQMGMDLRELKAESRKLVFQDPSGQWEFLLVKPSDVPTYVDHGVADIGIAGKDTLMEEARPLYELLDLEYGKCRLSICGFPHNMDRLITSSNFRIATKYPNIARGIYEARGTNIEIIKLQGSVELGPLVGLSDVILDIVESGNTLKANGLVELEEICPISARLVVNRVSLKIKSQRIRPFIEEMRKAIEIRRNGK